MLNESGNLITAYMWHNRETGEAYVGSTKNTPRRKREHERDLANNSHKNKQFQKAYNDNPNFDFVALPLQSREEAFEFEQSAIDDFFGDPLFLNMSRNARACIVDPTPEFIEKMRTIVTGRKYGKRSPEQIEKNRQGHLGLKQSVETIEKRAAALRGKPRPDVAEINRKNWTDKKHSDKSRALMSESAKARGYSDTAINAMCKAVSKSITVDGVVFESASEAARIYGIDPGTALDRVKSSNPKFQHWQLNLTQG